MTTGTPGAFSFWRPIHLVASAAVVGVGALHFVLAIRTHEGLSPHGLMVMGIGLALLLLGVLNFTHVGIEPCRRPTARLVRWMNWPFAFLGLASMLEMHHTSVIVVFAVLLAQAVAGIWTLPGPARGAPPAE